MKCTTTVTLQLLFFLTSSGSWNTQKAISSLEPSSDVDTVTAMGKSETSVGRRSSDEDDDEDDVSCEWFPGFSVGERDRRSTFANRSRRSCIHLFSKRYNCVPGWVGQRFHKVKINVECTRVRIMSSTKCTTHTQSSTCKVQLSPQRAMVGGLPHL